MTRAPLWQAYQVASPDVAEFHGGKEWSANGISIDTRTLREGDLFVALEAARDGHDFVASAFEKGAAAVIVSRKVDADGPQVVVDSPLGALRNLAKAGRDRNFGRLIGVTGSAGKTTTKEMLRHALAPLGKVHAAVKSFNNHIGVPITMAELPPDADAAVIEMGMNHAGEIRDLTKLVQPHIAIITTIAEAHIENLGSLEGIADAKSEISEGLRPGGSMILPADSPFLPRLKERCTEAGAAYLLTFGKTGDDAKLLSTENVEGGLLVNADIQGTEVRFRLHAQGEHMASNAVAALLAATVAGADPRQAAESLQEFRSGEGRGAQIRMRFGDASVTLLDESYNANPASMRASLSVLANAKGRRVAVLGEMKELGEASPSLHAGLADAAAAAADIVHTAGDDMLHLRNALPEAVRGTYADKAIDLVQTLLDDVNEADTLLFKGSNASKVGDLVQALLKVGQRL
ncbi:MAG: UDP-N-acetylmuramoyl-tripeptide--D-alanyl-D-alanine ligase [Pseudomonadota bacterium]